MQAAGVLGASEQGSRSLVRLSSLGADLFLHSAFPTESRDAVFLDPDTYKFVDAIRAHLGTRSAPIRRAVDIWTGAGPGGVATARAVPEAGTLLLDINQAALRLAAYNVAMSGLGPVSPRYSDLLSGVAGDFDLIVAHPPYLADRGSRLYRDGGGLLGADLSLAIVEHGTARLTRGGSLLLFTGAAMVGGRDPFQAAVQALLERTELSWSYREVDVDVFGEELGWPPYDRADRIALVVLTLTRHG